MLRGCVAWCELHVLSLVSFLYLIWGFLSFLVELRLAFLSSLWKKFERKWLVGSSIYSNKGVSYFIASCFIFYGDPYSPCDECPLVTIKKINSILSTFFWGNVDGSPVSKWRVWSKI